MKKLCCVAMILFNFLLLTTAEAYIAYFTVEDPHLDALHGFEFSVEGADVDTLELSVFHTTDSVIGKSGAVPPQLTDAFPWEIDKSLGGVFGFDWSFAPARLRAS